MRSSTIPKIFFIPALLFFMGQLAAQTPEFTHDDTLRGSITPQRAWWDLTFYDLKVKVNPSDKSISGSNTIYYKVLTTNNILQFDLQSPLRVERVEQDGQQLDVRQTDKNACFVTLKKEQPVGSIQ